MTTDHVMVTRAEQKGFVNAAHQQEAQCVVNERPIEERHHPLGPCPCERLKVAFEVVKDDDSLNGNVFCEFSISLAAWSRRHDAGAVSAASAAAAGIVVPDSRSVFHFENKTSGNKII